MIDCKEIAEKLSKGEHYNLGVFKKMEFNFHILICGCCKAYKKHIESLNIGANKLFDKFVSENEEDIKKIEDEALEKIKKSGS